MEEIFPTLVEDGILAVIVLFLLTKGVNALNQLTNSVNELTKTVGKLSGVNERLNKIEFLIERMSKNVG